jgi:hypothetical protein
LVTDIPNREYDKCAKMVYVISKDPVEGKCPDGYDMTKDAEKCVRAQEVDCDDDNSNSPLCTGEKGRRGSIFCDEYAQLTGSRIAYGGCYDRNDVPDEYCDQYVKEFTSMSSYPSHTSLGIH